MILLPRGSPCVNVLTCFLQICFSYVSLFMVVYIILYLALLTFNQINVYIWQQIIYHRGVQDEMQWSSLLLSSPPIPCLRVNLLVFFFFFWSLPPKLKMVGFIPLFLDVSTQSLFLFLSALSLSLDYPLSKIQTLEHYSFFLLTFCELHIFPYIVKVVSIILPCD